MRIIKNGAFNNTDIVNRNCYPVADTCIQRTKYFELQNLMVEIENLEFDWLL